MTDCRAMYMVTVMSIPLMNIMGSKIIKLCGRVLGDQRILAGLLVICIFTVAYGVVHVRSNMMPLPLDKKPSVEHTQEYSEYEKCQSGLRFFIAINRLWLSLSTVPNTEHIQGGSCTPGNYYVCGDSLTIRVSLTL